MSVFKKEKGFAFVKDKTNSKANSADELINETKIESKKKAKKVFPLTMTEEQHKRLKEMASNSGLSINSYALIKIFGIK